MNKVILEDLNLIANSNIIDWTRIKNKTFFITGATGLIGSILVKSINIRNLMYNDNIKMVLLVRNKEQAQNIFDGIGNIFYIENSVENMEESTLNMNIDFIIHAASPTKSKFFIENPTETLDIAILGTRKVLELAKRMKVESIVYLSSMEMYGVLDSKNTKETDLGYINPLDVRSSYSAGKRICELYSYSYFSEYKVPVKIARLAQTFGAGISKNENRVYKYFIDCILNKQDIVLKSTGTTPINFTYTTDTILGILTILLHGKNGEAYNIVSDNINMTILDSAKWLAKEFCENQVKVIVDIPKEKTGFAPDNQMVLSNKKLKNLGWKCKFSVKDGYERLINYIREEMNNEKKGKIDI